MEYQFPSYEIGCFRHANERGKYDSSLFRDILRISGIQFEPSPPYKQHKNGVSGRMIWTLTTKARAVILSSHLDDKFRAETVNTANHLHTVSPSRPIRGGTPFIAFDDSAVLFTISS